MVSASVLGAAAGTGLALFVAVTIVVYRYYLIKQRTKEYILAMEMGNKRKKLTLSTTCSSVYIPPRKVFGLQKEDHQVQPRPPVLSLPSFESPPGVHPPFPPLSMAASPAPRRASVCSTDLSPRQIPRLVSVDDGRSLLAVTRRGSDSCRAPSPLICTTSPEGSSSHFLGAEFRVPLHRSSSVDARCSVSPSSYVVPDSPRSPGPHSRPGSPRVVRPLSPLLIPKYPSSDSSSCSPGAASPIGAIQPELYKKNDILVLDTDMTPGGGSRFGRLHFRLKYDFDRSDLIVHVIEAHDLVQPDQGGFNDPYVKVSLLPEVDSRKRQTDIRRNSANPFFNETFTFPVALDDLPDKVLLLQVFDYDKYSRNDMTGEVRLPMRDVDVASEIEVWSGIKKNKKPPGENQELLLSLSYLPSAERLTVVILKARNLIATNSKETPDAYVKVYLLNGSKRVKKKKTNVRRGSSNPVWNEAVSFNVAADALPHTTLELAVLNHDLLGNTPQIGSCFVGPQIEGAGQEHWIDMMQSLRKSVAMWHSLK